MPKKQRRPIDSIVKENYSWWGKTFVFIKKAEIKTWQSIFALAFIAGAASMMIWGSSAGIGQKSKAATNTVYSSSNCQSLSNSIKNYQAQAGRYCQLAQKNKIYKKHCDSYTRAVAQYKKHYADKCAQNQPASSSGSNSASNSVAAPSASGAAPVAKFATDHAVYESCANKAIAGICDKADFNSDKAVTLADYSALWKIILKYDLNGDSMVDMNADYAIWKACTLDSSTSSCAKSDLNSDKAVNTKDIDELNGAITRYDLNQDGILSVATFPLKTVAIDKTSDYSVWQSCYRRLAIGSCAKADFDADGIITLTDYAALRKVAGQYDYALWRKCYRSDATGECAAVDYDKDNSITLTDYAEIRKMLGIYDLNGDLMISMAPNTAKTVVIDKTSDYSIWQSCYRGEAIGDCSKADFDGDGVITLTDYAELRKVAGKYDYALWRKCYRSEATGECAAANYDNDNMITLTDYAELTKVLNKFDLNGDKKITM